SRLLRRWKAPSPQSIKISKIGSSTFSSLLVKLETTTQRFTRLTKPANMGIVKKLKIAFLKDAFEETVAELESWQKLYKPSWFCWIKLASPAIGNALNNAI